MRNETDNMKFGDCTFQITTANEIMLKALIKYSMWLDYVTAANEDEMLNVEGLINNIIAEGMQRRIKDLTKKHSFEDVEEFIDCMTCCSDGEEVASEIKSHELSFYRKTHDEILAYIPIEDKQMRLFESKQEKEN